MEPCKRNLQRLRWKKQLPGKYAEVSKEDSYFLGKYTAVEDTKVDALPEEEAKEIKEVVKSAKQGALAKVTIFPAFMLICYLGLIFYFKSKGGYAAVEIGGNTSKTDHVSEA